MPVMTISRGPAGLTLLALLLFFIGAALPAHATDRHHDPRDPLEGFNRGVFAFNETLDQYLLKPTAKGYRAVTPSAMEQSIGNFFNNLGELKSFGNDLLQGKPGSAGRDLGRFVINTTVGVLGLFDVATQIGLERQPEDFGQTLAVWGVGSGPYLMLPFFGPSTLRDGTGLAVDTLTSVDGNVDPERARYYAKALDIVDTRASLLESEDLVTGDRYSFLRDAYLQRREFLINDGNMQDTFGGDDFEEFEEF